MVDNVLERTVLPLFRLVQKWCWWLCILFDPLSSAIHYGCPSLLSLGLILVRYLCLFVFKVFSYRLFSFSVPSNVLFIGIFCTVGLHYILGLIQQRTLFGRCFSLKTLLVSLLLYFLHNLSKLWQCVDLIFKWWWVDIYVYNCSLYRTTDLKEILWNSFLHPLNLYFSDPLNLPCYYSFYNYWQIRRIK